MLVFPPPFTRKCHPRCAKQILDFTFLLQMIKDEVVQGKFLGWFGGGCSRWVRAQGELEGLSTRISIFLNSIPPLSTWVPLSPSTVSRGNWHLHMGQTPSRGASTDCRPRAPYLRGDDSRSIAHQCQHLSQHSWGEESPVLLARLAQC